MVVLDMVIIENGLVKEWSCLKMVLF